MENVEQYVCGLFLFKKSFQYLGQAGLELVTFLPQFLSAGIMHACTILALPFGASKHLSMRSFYMGTNNYFRKQIQLVHCN